MENEDTIELTEGLASIGINDALLMDRDTFEDITVDDDAELFKNGIINLGIGNSYRHKWIIVKLED